MKHLIVFGICTFLLLSLDAQSDTTHNKLKTSGGVGGASGIIDLHCHPSLKMYLFNTHIWKRHHSAAGINLFDMQIDTRTLGNRNVTGFIATHYLLERGFVKKSLINVFLPLLKAFDPALVAKVENEDYSNFAQINNMLDILEVQIRDANATQSDVKLKLVRNFREFEQAIKDGEIPVAHAIEGGHALGRNMASSEKKKKAQQQKVALGRKIKPGSQHEFVITNSELQGLTPDNKANYKKYRKIKAPAYNGMMLADGNPETKYIQNLNALFERGVCMMAISHFLPNDFTDPTEGVSPDAKKTFHMEWGYDPKTNNIKLTPVGRKVVERMLQIGMIVDLTHTNPVSRQEIFEMNDGLNKIRIADGKRPRPLIFSHAGIQHVFNEGNAGDKELRNQNYGFYDLSDQEIDKIALCHGVIGVIPENFWLKACDKKINYCGCDCSMGIPIIIETINYIYKRTGSYENICIGSDFDGLADSPKDLYNPLQYVALIKAMKDDNISEADIALITHDNALRILRDGWGD